MLKELREKAYRILSDGKWLSTVQEDKREVQVSHDGFYCHSYDRFDPEFTTNNIDVAVNYLYPEY